MRLEESAVTWPQLRVGIFVFLCFGLLLTAFVFVGGRLESLSYPFTLYVVLDSASGLDTDTPVRLAGIEVGRVKALGFINHDGVNKVQAHLRLKEEAAGRLRSDSIVQLKAVGLTDKKYMDISLGSSQGSPIEDGVTLSVVPSTEMSDILNQVLIVSQDTNRLLTRLESGNGTFARLLREDVLYNNLNQTVRGASQVAQTLNHGQGLLPQLLAEQQIAENVMQGTASLAAFGQQVTQGEGTLGQLSNDPALFDGLANLIAQSEGVLTRFEARLNQLDATIATTDGLIQRVDSGEGTLAQLINTPDLHHQLHATAKKAETLIDSTQSSDGTVGRLLTDASVAENVESTAKSISGVAEKLNKEGNTLDQLTQNTHLFDRLLETTTKLDSILAKINRGEGSIGKLANDKQTADDLAILIANLKTLLADIQAHPKKYVEFSLF